MINMNPNNKSYTKCNLLEVIKIYTSTGVRSPTLVRGIPCPTTILVNCVRGVRCPTLLSFLVSNILRYLHNSVLPTNIAIYFDRNT